MGAEVWGGEDLNFDDHSLFYCLDILNQLRVRTEFGHLSEKAGVDGILDLVALSAKGGTLQRSSVGQIFNFNANGVAA